MNKETDWILINPFNKNYTNDMIGLIQEDTDEAAKVQGLIFDTDSIMTSEKIYDKPPIMSEASATKCDILKPYAYNKQEDPTLFTYQVVYQHFFSENCGVLTSIVPTYFTFAGAWATLAAFSTLHLYVFTPGDSRLSL